MVLEKPNYLLIIANDISEKEFRYIDTFFPERPLFSRVFAISYSPFDNFKKPSKEHSKKSYKYCGIRGEDGSISIDNLKER